MSPRILQKKRSASALVVALLAGLACLCAGPQSAFGREGKNRLPAQMIQALQEGEPQEFYVEIDDTGVSEALGHLRRVTNLNWHEETELTVSLRAKRLKEIKDHVLGLFATREITVLYRYEHLNLLYVRIEDEEALARLLIHPKVRMVYPSGRISPSLAQSRSMIEQGYAASLGHKGAGTVVAVIDTGVDYLRYNSSGQKYFGNCIQPPWYSGCKLLYALDCTTGFDNCIDHDSPNLGGDSRYDHGTHVAATILGVAPDTKIISLRIFTSGIDNIYDSRLTQAVEEIVALKASYNIVAVNMSFNYDAPRSTGSCDAAHEYARNLISQITSYDIVPVVSAGNTRNATEQAVAATQMKSPACIQAALSVSSVIDHNDDPDPWGSLCNDIAGSKSKVSCWAMRSSITDLLAPGELITAADMTKRGTSMAAPHVSGAVAVLRGSQSLSQAQTQQRLKDAGILLYDSASGVWRPFLSLRNLFP